jgi:hypothetical protein
MGTLIVLQQIRSLTDDERRQVAAYLRRLHIDNLPAVIYWLAVAHIIAILYLLLP